MPSIDETVAAIAGTDNWDARINAIRLIPAEHGYNEHQAIYAEVARRLYVPHLGPDFAYVYETRTYALPEFQDAYRRLLDATDDFSHIGVDELSAAMRADPVILLPLRTITGLTTNEFAESTRVVADELGVRPLGPSKITSMERTAGARPSAGDARLAAMTIDRLVRRQLFEDSPLPEVRLKQDKPDTANGWDSVRAFDANGVPFDVFLHQRHYGGAFRQLLDATSTKRGNLIEDAVEELFQSYGIPYIRTGSHNQGEIAERFGVHVHPAPDFVVYDTSDALRAMLECKGANDGGTARDKALRFRTLQEEAQRLGGVPLLAVLGGLGWRRVNDTLGPVIRDTDGRVLSLGNLTEMLSVSPLPSLIGLA